MAATRQASIVAGHALTAAWIALTAAALLLPPAGLGSVLPGIAWLRLAVVFAGWGLDKLLHTTLFAVLAFLLARSLRQRGRRPALTRAALLAAGYAVLTELAQQWVPGRSADAWDLAANLCGVALGLWASLPGLRRVPPQASL